MILFSLQKVFQQKSIGVKLGANFSIVARKRRNKSQTKKRNKKDLINKKSLAYIFANLD